MRNWPATLVRAATATGPGDKRTNFYPLVLVGITCLALGLRLLGFDKGIWLDEFVTRDWVLSVNLASMFQKMRIDAHPPLYFVLLRAWSYLGQGEATFRLLSVIFGVGLVVIAMVWMKRYSSLSSILTGIILATLPVVIRFSQEIRGYALLLCATALAFYFASRLKAEPQRLTGYVGLTVSLAVAVLTHMVGVMLIIPVWLFIVTMNSDWQRIEPGKAFLTIAIPAALFIYCKYFFLYRSPSHDWWMPQVNLVLLWSIFRYVQDSLAGTWPVNLFTEENPALGVYVSNLAMLLCLILAFIFLALGQWRRTLPFLLAAITYWGELLAYSVAVLPIIWNHTLLPGIVPLAGFVGLHVATLKRPALRTAYTVIIVLLSLALATTWVTRKAWESREQWGDVAKILSAQWRSQDLAIFYPGFIRGTVQYYFPGMPPESIIEATRGGRREQLAAEIHRKIEAHKTTQLINVFLIIRQDIPMMRDLTPYRHLIMDLKEQMPKTATLQLLLHFRSHNRIPRGLLATRQEILQWAAANFGPPLSFNVYGELYWLRYGGTLPTD
jgi:hypothetical protein